LLISQLFQGLKKLEKIQTKLKSLNGKIINRDLIETKNLLETATLIVKAAMKRKKSLGCHFVD